MCGIVGLYGSNTHMYSKDKKEFLLQALLVDSLRGADSTGLAKIPRRAGEKPEIYKRAISGPDFVQLKPTLRLVEKMSDSHGFIGHNRSMTRGAVEDETSHPFQYNHITLVHNGTVYNSDKLIKGGCRAESPVDSAQVAWSFSVCEPDDVLPIMSGPFSLVWWDSRDGTLHFARNEEKPMYWSIDTTGSCMYFASELRMLNWLLDRNGIKVTNQSKYTAPGQHYVFKNPQNVEDYTVRPFLKAASKNPKAGGSNNWKRDLTGKSLLSDHQPQRGGPMTVIGTPASSSQSSKSPTSTTSQTTPTTTQTTPAAPASTTKSTIITSTDTTRTTDEHAEVIIQLPEGSKRTEERAVRTDSAFYTKDGKKHPAESERLKRGYVGTILQGLKDNKRQKNTQELAEKVGVEPFKHILAVPKMFVPYYEEAAFGVMFLRKGEANIQCFNVTLPLWTKCAKGGLYTIPIKIVGHRLAFDDDPVFIGEVDADRIDRLIIARQSVSKSASPNIVTTPFDAEDLIEINTHPPKYVTLDEFQVLVEPGCMKCMRPILVNEAGDMGLAGPDQDWPICSTCWNQPMVRAEFDDATTAMDKRVH